MPFTPDAPFPKSSGDPIRSKDWNDLVQEATALDAETGRLEGAKVNRAGDTITGSLSIQDALVLGKLNAAADTKLDIWGNLRINYSSLYLGSDNFHGLALRNNFATLPVDGPVLFGYSGGALGTSNHTNSEKLALNWDSHGRVAVGAPASWFLSPAASLPDGDVKLSVFGGLRANLGMLYLRDAPDTENGLGFFGDGVQGLPPTEWDGIEVNGPVLFGSSGGILGTKRSGVARSVLQWNAGGLVSIDGGLNVQGNIGITGDCFVGGRKLGDRLVVNIQTNDESSPAASQSIATIFTHTVSPTVKTRFLILVQIDGVAIDTGTAPTSVAFELVINSGLSTRSVCKSVQNFATLSDVRSVNLSHVEEVAPGSTCTISVRMTKISGTAAIGWSGIGGSNRLLVIEL